MSTKIGTVLTLLFVYCLNETSGQNVSGVFDVDFNVKENAIHHKTIAYELIKDILIVRRADYFNVSLSFKNDFHEHEEQLRLNFTYVSKVGNSYPSIYLPVVKNTNKIDPRGWHAVITSIAAKEVKIMIFLPANVAIGFWELEVAYKQLGKTDVYAVTEGFAVLFNPWSEEDSVYLPDEQQRQEYVLNQIGQVYLGSGDDFSPKLWKFGQFSEYIFPVVILLLENYGLNFTQLADPVEVSRALSSVINANDENGIIVGKWSGSFDDGVSPSEWSGSVRIFKQFFESQFQPVMYGQCWVYASTTTSACRAIGLPARPVTCFGSRHDTDESLTIDTYFDENNEPIEDMNNDMQWNFHVWTEAWMARHDLPGGYGGWQAIDATPQERSDGLMQAGPASVNAIKKGEIGFSFDNAFVFAEVDADIVHWHRNTSSDLGWTPIFIDSKPTTLFTKKIGKLEDEDTLFDKDVTSTYKYSKGTDEQKLAHKNAQKNRGLKFIFDQDNPMEKNIDFELDVKTVEIGKTFRISLKIVNKENEMVSISTFLNIKSVHYNGLIADTINKDRSVFSVDALGHAVHEIEIKPDEYLPKLVAFNMIKIYAFALVDSGSIWSQEKTIMLQKPTLNISIAGHIREGHTIDLTISFTNPLVKTLTEARLTVEIGSKKIVTELKNIGPNEEFVHDVQVKLESSGYETLIVAFNSKQLSDLYTYRVLDISKK